MTKNAPMIVLSRILRRARRAAARRRPLSDGSLGPIAAMAA
jgi:hypothetical protein